MTLEKTSTTIKLNLIANPRVTRDGIFEGKGSAQGGYVLIKLAPMHPFYRFNTKTGIGQGPARNWKVAPEEMKRVCALAKGKGDVLEQE